MKWFGLLITAIILHAYIACAQLPDGTTIPDFTFTDISGNTQNLYSYLNAGRYVAIDVFTTWCHPCWLYHNSGVMDSLYTKHDFPGDQTWKVLAIEGDATTTLADVQGTGTNTQGNWAAGALFPILNPIGVSLNDFLTNYNISFFPTLYVICPDKKVYQDTLNYGTKPDLKTWEHVAATQCGPSGLDNLKDANPLTIYPNPANEYTVLYFSLNSATELKLLVTNTLGQTVANRNFGKLSAGDQSLKFDVSDLNRGIYFFTVYDGNIRYIRKKVVVQ